MACSGVARASCGVRVCPNLWPLHSPAAEESPRRMTRPPRLPLPLARSCTLLLPSLPSHTHAPPTLPWYCPSSPPTSYLSYISNLVPPSAFIPSLLPPAFTSFLCPHSLHPFPYLSSHSIIHMLQNIYIPETSPWLTHLSPPVVSPQSYFSQHFHPFLLAPSLGCPCSKICLTHTRT